MKLFGQIRARFVRIPKQLRYVISSSLGAIFLFLAVGVPYPYSWIVLPFLCILSYILTWFALLEDLRQGEWLVLFILPVFWTASWYVSFYMLPMRFSIRIAFTLMYPLIFYIVVSAMNIFNVGVEKNIQLRRAAQAANQFITVIVFYLFTQVINSFGLSWIVLGLLTGVASWILGLQLFWTMSPSELISSEVKNLALFQGFVIGFFMILLSFLPFSLETPRPMIITGVFYVVNGVLAIYTDAILVKQRIREYLSILILLILAAILTLRW